VTPSAHALAWDDDAGASVGAAEVAAVLSDPARRFVLATHRNPDGDALGSMLALTRALRAAGRDAVMWHCEPDPVRPDLRFLFRPDEAVLPELPADAGERTLIAVDCASAHRLSDLPPGALAGTVLNLDHHHDNTRFGDLNLVEPTASSTAEVIVHVLEAAGWPLDVSVAEPLYVGLVTDTGRFSQANTSPEAHRVAALLAASGLDIVGISRALYEEEPLQRLRLLGRALAGVRSLLGGRLIVAVLTREDFDAAGATCDDTEGIVETLRRARGARVAALVRERDEGLRVSLRSATPEVDVSAIARAEGGGGHRAAAGCTSQRPLDELLEGLTAAVAAQLDDGSG
jgi:bifunctional oligoribonuclease and PAP phosphatase NrnA